MENRELEDLLVDLESDRVERKSSISDRTSLSEAICAFANDLPGHRQAGVCFIGVDDRGGCAGYPITDQLLRTLADLRSDGNLLPFPTMTVQKRILRGCELAVVLVEPSEVPPVRYRGRTYVRVGPTTRIATPEEERRLSERRRAADLPFDVRTVPSATLDDLDLELFRRTYLPANPHLAEAMKNLGYVQRFGVGIPIARRELEKNGNPPLEFIVEASHILAVVRSRI